MIALFRLLGDSPQLKANRLLFLIDFPNRNRTPMPIVQRTINPASRLTPPSIPSLSNMGRENRIAANANKLRDRLFAEKMLAA